MREMRWRDRSGVVHEMHMTASGRGYLNSVWCEAICGAHRATAAFKHPKYSPLPVSCVYCLGYVSPYPR
jgi:hypothetical protein